MSLGKLCEAESPKSRSRTCCFISIFVNFMLMLTKKENIFHSLGFEDDRDYNQDCLFYNFQLLLSWNFFPRESVQSTFLSVCDFISLLQVAPVFFLEIAKHPSYKKLIADIYISISMGKRIQANHNVVIHRKYKSRGEDGNK